MRIYIIVHLNIVSSTKKIISIASFNGDLHGNLSAFILWDAMVWDENKCGHPIIDELA